MKGAIDVRLRLLDGTIEDKIFAPRYGEFRASVAAVEELYHLALANPTDSLPGPVPGQLSALMRDAARTFGQAGAGNWGGAAATADRMDDSWESYADDRPVPSHLRKQMNDALKALEKAVRAKDSVVASQAAIDVSHATLDVQLRYRGQDAGDVDRLAVWNKQLQLDTAVADEAGIAGDHVAIDAITDRINH